MLVPGSNLLNMALSVLGKQCFAYYAFASRTPNSIGQDVTTYAPPMNLQGSIQPVPRNLYEQYGLDFQRNYVVFYVSTNVLDVTRDVSGDQIVFSGKKFQSVSANDWFPMDGWVGILAVQIPN